MVLRCPLIKKLPKSLPADKFKELFLQFCNNEIDSEKFVLACLSRSLIHLNYLYLMNKISYEVMDETISTMSVKVMNLSHKETPELLKIENPAAYIFHMTHSAILDLYRTRSATDHLDILETMIQAPQTLECIDLINDLYHLTKDSLDYKILQLRIQQKTHREISEALDVAATTVSARLFTLYNRYLATLQEDYL